MGTPTSKSCKPLIAEHDCSLTAGYYLQVPYMSYYWNQIGLTIEYTGKNNTYTNKQKWQTPHCRRLL